MSKDNRYYYIGIAVFQHKKLEKPLSRKTGIIHALAYGNYGIKKPTPPIAFLELSHRLLIKELKMKYQEVLNIMNISDKEFYNSAYTFKYEFVEMEYNRHNLPVDPDIVTKLGNKLELFRKDYQLQIVQKGIKIMENPNKGYQLRPSLRPPFIDHKEGE